MERLHYFLMKAHTCLNREILSRASALGLSPGQPKVLECLLHNGQSNQKSIAEFCEIEQATVGSILFRMERDGLIFRTQYERNRRALCVALTPEGREKAEQMEEIFQRADAQAVAGLSPEQCQQLLTLLQAVCNSMEAPGKGMQK